MVLPYTTVLPHILCSFCADVFLWMLFFIYTLQIILIPFDNFYTACVHTVSACCSHFTAIVHQLTRLKVPSKPLWLYVC